MELIDNIDGMITSLDHCPDSKKDELIMDIKTEKETLKGLVQEYWKRKEVIIYHFLEHQKTLRHQSKVKPIFFQNPTKSIQKFNLWKNWKRKN